jgi:hypothetical protein
MIGMYSILFVFDDFWVKLMRSGYGRTFVVFVN